MRRRDPVKRAIWGAAAAAIAMLVWMGCNMVRLAAANSALQVEQSKFDALEKGFKTTKDNLKLTGEYERNYDSLREMASIRPLWAPMLDGLQKCMLSVTNVQVMRIRSSQNYQYTDAVKAKPGTAVKAKPSYTTQIISVVIDGRDYGDPAEQNYNKFKESIVNNAFFKEIITNPNDIRLKELSPPQSDPLDPSKTFVAFSIECRYPDRIREAH